jgi:battenin
MYEPSSGLGELTFLQLSTTYSPPSVGGSSVGYVLQISCPLFGNRYIVFQRYFASGTGGAGLVGAFLWWEVRGLGVREGVGLSAVSIKFFPSFCIKIALTFSDALHLCSQRYCRL